MNENRDASGVTDAAPSPFACLPIGEEQIVVEITGNPPLTVTTPDGVACLSRFLPATASDDALLDLQWNAPSVSVFVVVRMRQVTPAQTGAVTPYSILLSQGAESWSTLGDKCSVTIGSSTKIGEMAQPPSSVQEFYKVAGSMTCDNGWAPAKPNDELKKFEFATRATFLRMQ